MATAVERDEVQVEFISAWWILAISVEARPGAADNELIMDACDWWQDEYGWNPRDHAPMVAVIREDEDTQS